MKTNKQKKKTLGIWWLKWLFTGDPACLFQVSSDSGGSPLIIFHSFTAQVIWYCRYACRLHKIIEKKNLYSLVSIDLKHCHKIVLCLFLWLRHSCVRAARLQGLWDPGEDGGRYCHHAAEHRRWGHTASCRHTFTNARIPPAVPELSCAHKPLRSSFSVCSCLLSPQPCPVTCT